MSWVNKRENHVRLLTHMRETSRTLMMVTLRTLMIVTSRSLMRVASRSLMRVAWTTSNGTESRIPRPGFSYCISRSNPTPSISVITLVIQEDLLLSLFCFVSQIIVAVGFWKWQEIFCESVKIFCEIIENWNFHRKLCNFRGRDYRTFAENFLAKSQDTRKPRIISRSDGDGLWCCCSSQNSTISFMSTFIE